MRTGLKLYDVVFGLLLLADLAFLVKVSYAWYLNPTDMSVAGPGLAAGLFLVILPVAHAFFRKTEDIKAPAK